MLHFLAICIVCFFIGCWSYTMAMTFAAMRDRGEGTVFWRAIIVMPAFVGLLVDILFFNFFLATIVYLELPKELTFSSRLARHDNYRRADRWHFQRVYTRFWVCQLNAVTGPGRDHIH